MAARSITRCPPADENDSIIVFDKVFVTWENVFAYGDIDKVNNFFPRSGFLPPFSCSTVAHGWP